MDFLNLFFTRLSFPHIKPIRHLQMWNRILLFSQTLRFGSSSLLSQLLFLLMLICFGQSCCQLLSKNPCAPFEIIVCDIGNNDDLPTVSYERSSTRKLCSLDMAAHMTYTSCLVKSRHSSFNANIYCI